MRRSRTLAIAMAGLLTLGAAACGGDDDDEATDDPTTTTEAVDEETTTTVGTDETDDTTGDDTDDATTTTVSDEGNTEIEQLAQSLLVTLDDLGIEGFQDLGYSPSPGPNQCGFDIDAEHPSQVLVGTDLGNNDTLEFLQEIRVYATPDEATAAFQAGVDGAQCTPDDGTVIEAPVDVTTDVEAQQAVAITATQGDINVIVVAALLSDAVVSFTFVGAGDAGDSAPNPIDVAAFGIGKIKAALGEG